MGLPASSLRWPVSIAWAINTLTFTPPSLAVARMRVGSVMLLLLFWFRPNALRALASAETSSSVTYRWRLAAASADGDFDLFFCHVVLALRLHQYMHLGRLRHFHPRAHRGLGPGGNVEACGQRSRVLGDQDGNRFRARDFAYRADRHDGAVLGDFRCRHHDVVRIDGT